MPGRPWTQKEINYLSEFWGTQTKELISAKLKRTKFSLKQKAWELGLGPQRLATDKITAGELARVLGVDRSTIVYQWIKRYDLEAVDLGAGKKIFRMISIDTFWTWAEKNQHLFDASLIDPLVLGPEPDWLKFKRKEDFYRGRNATLKGGK